VRKKTRKFMVKKALEYMKKRKAKNSENPSGISIG
jgi:hypothetical protein